MDRKVVITGIGPVSSIGRGTEEFWSAITSQKSNIKKIPEQYLSKYNFKSKFYIPAPKSNLERFGVNKNLTKMMDNASLLAVESAFFALKDANLNILKKGKYFSVENLKNSGIIFGVGVSHIASVTESVFTHILSDNTNYLEKLNFAKNFPMMSAVKVMANSTASWLSIFFGIEGSSLTVNTACSSANLAIGESYRKIKDGYNDIMICGGTSSMESKFGSIMRAFDVLGTLTKSKDGNPRPFSPERSGFLFADGGACTLILEEKSHAEKRGAKIYAEIDGFEANSEAKSIVQISNSGEKIEQIIKNLTKNNKIDYINAHGTATILNDKIESELFRKIFGNKEKQPLINTTKALLGHTIAASGAFETAITALSIYNQQVHGMPIEKPMENLNIVLKTKPAKIERAINLSYGFGGHNTGLSLKKRDENG